MSFRGFVLIRRDDPVWKRSAQFTGINSPPRISPPLLLSSPPPFINPQVPVYGSMDNLFAEPYQGDARASFNSRTQLVPIPVNASIENLLSLHESHSTDWGRPSLNLPIGDASLREKREGGDAEITPDPAFFNHFLQSSVTTPPPHEEAPLPEGRSSALSSGDPDSVFPMHLPRSDVAELPADLRGSVGDGGERATERRQRDARRTARRRRQTPPQVGLRSLCDVDWSATGSRRG